MFLERKGQNHKYFGLFLLGIELKEIHLKKSNDGIPFKNTKI